MRAVRMTAPGVLEQGTRAELQEVIALGRLGTPQADVQTFPLERAPEAYDLLRRGEIRGRAVIVP